MGNPAAGGELADLVGIEARLRGEVEAVELARAGEGAIFSALSTRRSFLRATSRAQRKAMASRRVRSRRAASSRSVSSPSRSCPR